jgi:glycosyltransferase involved in cell wall biosynthesis
VDISFSGAPDYMDRMVGFGNASYYIFENLKKFGINPKVRDRDSKIGISFCQPQDYKFAKDQYRIGYTPWESTGFYPGWVKIMNSCDEIWATSPWVADIYKSKLNVPIFVYEHGIDKKWSPIKKNKNVFDKIRFLHVGEPAERKDAQLVVDVFVELYGNNPKYELIIKCSGKNNTRVYDKSGKFSPSHPSGFYKNIKIIDNMLSTEQMFDLYRMSDVFVYPSWGEGFGLNPFQAIGMGIPTICTSGWATYKDYITLPLDSSWERSPWDATHPGMMLKPNREQLRQHMIDVVQDYEKYSQIAFKNAFIVHEKWDWTKVTEPAVKKLQNIYNSKF